MLDILKVSMRYMLIMALMVCQACLGQTPDLVGTWSGHLKFGGTELPFLLHVKKEQGEYKAYAESPKQSTQQIPTKMRVQGDSVFFDITGGIQVKGLVKEEIGRAHV